MNFISSEDDDLDVDRQGTAPLRSVELGRAAGFISSPGQDISSAEHGRPASSMLGMETARRRDAFEEILNLRQNVIGMRALGSFPLYGGSMASNGEVSDYAINGSISHCLIH